MKKHVILFLAANPPTSNQLRLAEECAEIQRELKMASHRDDFQFESRWAVSIDELMRHLNELAPTVIHFSGHGGGDSGLLLQDEQGHPQPVSGRALAMMVDAAARDARVIVLNACYSIAQAEVLRAKVECVAGMDGAIGDDAARTFAIRFYGALGNCRSIGNAVDQGVAALAAKQLPDEVLPRCVTRDGVDKYQVFLDPPIAASLPLAGAGARAEQWAIKRAEVGGEVLMATLSFLSALSSVVGAFVHAPKESGDDPRDEHAPLRRAMENVGLRSQTRRHHSSMQ